MDRAVARGRLWRPAPAQHEPSQFRMPDNTVAIVSVLASSVITPSIVAVYALSSRRRDELLAAHDRHLALLERALDNVSRGNASSKSAMASGSKVTNPAGHARAAQKTYGSVTSAVLGCADSISRYAVIASPFAPTSVPASAVYRCGITNGGVRDAFRARPGCGLPAGAAP
jgi:hypothetical protein